MLINEKVINCNKSIISNLIDNYNSLTNTGYYLYPEIKQYVDKKYFRFHKIPENLEELRKIEYGNNPILQLIQRDSLDEFILYINTNKFYINDEIEYSSILETNPFINQFDIQKAVEYAAFFGSVKISNIF